MSPNVSLALPAHTQVLLVVWVDRDVMKAVFEVDARHPVASLQKRADLPDVLHCESGCRDVVVELSEVQDHSQLPILFRDDSQRADVCG